MAAYANPTNSVKIPDKLSHLVEIVIATKYNSVCKVDKKEVGVCLKNKKGNLTFFQVSFLFIVNKVISKAI